MQNCHSEQIIAISAHLDAGNTRVLKFSSTVPGDELDFSAIWTFQDHQQFTSHARDAKSFGDEWKQNLLNLKTLKLLSWYVMKEWKWTWIEETDGEQKLAEPVFLFLCSKNVVLNQPSLLSLISEYIFTYIFLTFQSAQCQRCQPDKSDQVILQSLCKYKCSWTNSKLLQNAVKELV